MSSLSVGFAGMTHLGINSSIAAAVKGVDVVCFDFNEEHVNKLQSGELSIQEPDLDTTFKSIKGKIKFTHEVSSLNKTSFVIISPDIKTDDEANSDLSEILKYIDYLDQQLDSNINFVVLSQVPPGFCSQLKLAHNRKLYYQVETLIFGQALDRALHPERIIVGCVNDNRAIFHDYQSYLELFKCPVLSMSYESAELTKIAINCCLVSSVSVANTLAELCEQVGANWSEMIPALKLDQRIGQYAYLSAGLGIAGGNLERDLKTVQKLAAKNATNSTVVDAWISNSHYRKDWVLRYLYQNSFVSNLNPKLSIWGLAYKKDTDSVKNSPAINLIEQLPNFKINVYDPVVSVDQIEIETDNVSQFDDLYQASADSEIIIVMTPWSIFAEVDLPKLKEVMIGNTIIDPYQVIDEVACREFGFNYITLGQ